MKHPFFTLAPGPFRTMLFVFAGFGISSMVQHLVNLVTILWELSR